MAWPVRGARYIDGRSKHPLHDIWRQMVKRCTDPANSAWSHYGGRGIQVCERWLDFWLFVEDMSPRPEGRELDRIDNDGNYEPSNVRWATRSEQNSNRRKPEKCPAGHAYAEFGKVTSRGRTVCTICDARQKHESYQRSKQREGL